MKQVTPLNLDFEARDGYERSVVLNEKDFGANAKVQIVRLAPGGHIKPHYHKARTELVQILSGTGEVVVNGTKVLDTAGSFVLIQPGDVHELFNRGEEPMLMAVFRTNDPGNEDMIWADKEAK